MPSEARFDSLRVYLILLLSHMLKDSPDRCKIAEEKLLPLLDTPSESVQKAVSEILSLYKNNENSKLWRENLSLNLFSKGTSYAAWRGAAYGLSVLLDDFAVILEPFGQGSAKSRLGSLFLIELLSKSLGMAFEPWATHCLHVCVRSTADASPEIRKAAEDATTCIVEKALGKIGCRISLPVLIAELSSSTLSSKYDLPASSWRSKVCAANLLGAIVLSDLKNLGAASLSISINALIETLTTSSHSQVQESCKGSLLKFARTIKCPEISSISPLILSALSDPSSLGSTASALHAIAETSFGHVIDSASLSLICPLMLRVLARKDKDDNAVKMACMILGCLASGLVDPTQLLPYMPAFQNVLLRALLDANPAIRLAVSKAIAAILRTFSRLSPTHDTTSFAGYFSVDVALPKAAELQKIQGIVFTLQEMLRSELALERLGSAQALAECLAVKGPACCKLFLKENSELPSEGLVSLYSFLPLAFETNHSDCFELYSICHLEERLPEILAASGNSGGSDFLIASASKAARQIALRHHKLIGLDALFDLFLQTCANSVRIRLATLQLANELLSKLIPDAKQGVGMEYILNENLLSKRTVRRFLSQLYLSRHEHVENESTSEVASGPAALRATATSSWKMLVSHTPRAVLDIFPVLCQDLLLNIHSREEACKCATIDLLDRLGDRLLLPFLTHLHSCRHSHTPHVLKLSIWICAYSNLRVTNQNAMLPKQLLGQCLDILLDILALGLSDPQLSFLATALFSKMNPLLLYSGRLNDILSRIDEKGIAALMDSDSMVLAEAIIDSGAVNPVIIEKCPDRILRSRIKTLLATLDDPCRSVLIQRTCVKDDYEHLAFASFTEWLRVQECKASYLAMFVDCMQSCENIYWDGVHELWDAWSDLFASSASLFLAFAQAAKLQDPSDWILSKMTKMPANLTTRDLDGLLQHLLLPLCNAEQFAPASAIMDEIINEGFSLLGPALMALMGSLIRTRSRNKDTGSILMIDKLLVCCDSLTIKPFFPQLLRVCRAASDVFSQTALSHLIPLLPDKIRHETLLELDVFANQAALEMVLPRLSRKDLLELQSRFQQLIGSSSDEKTSQICRKLEQAALIHLKNK